MRRRDFRRTAAPLVTGLAVSGDALVEHAPARLTDVFGGAPALISLRLRPEGGTLRVTGTVPGGTFERTLRVPPVAARTENPAVAALFGREAVEDLETSLAGGAPRQEVDAAIEKLGLARQLATRLTSWVAISEEPTVDPTKPMSRERIPQQLPYGMSIEGLGLRRESAPRALLALSPSILAGAAPPPAASEEWPRGVFGFAAPGTARASASASTRARRERRSPVRPSGRITLDRAGQLVVELTADRELP